MKIRSFFLALVTVILMGFSVPSIAAELKGVMLNDSITIGNKTCRLNGIGLRKKLFISVYVGGLYMESSTSDEKKAITSDQTKRIVLKFLYKKVEKSKLIETWNEGFENNASPIAGVLRSKIDRFNSFFDDDILSGEEIVLTYIPAMGTEIVFKGKTKGVIEGKDFMEALFGIWLGKKPADTELKSKLLGH